MTVFMETLKTYVIVPTLIVIFLSFLIRNCKWNTLKNGCFVLSNM